MEKYETAAVVLKNHGYEDLQKSVEANMRISETAAAVLENLGHADLAKLSITGKMRRKND